MTHSAELARRMARARIGAGRDRAEDRRFPRQESDEQRRIPWESRPPMLPFGFNRIALLDAAIVVAALVLALSVAVVALP